MWLKNISETLRPRKTCPLESWNLSRLLLFFLFRKFTLLKGATRAAGEKPKTWYQVTKSRTPMPLRGNYDGERALRWVDTRGMKGSLSLRFHIRLMAAIRENEKLKTRNKV